MITKLILRTLLALEAAADWLLAWAKAYNAAKRYRRSVGSQIHQLSDNERRVIGVLYKRGLL